MRGRLSGTSIGWCRRMRKWHTFPDDHRLEVSKDGQVRNAVTRRVRKFSNGGSGYALVCLGDAAYWNGTNWRHLQ
jgi:hypothetical protein